MGINLRSGLFIATLSALAVIIVAVVRKRLNIKYSIVWLLWGLLSLLMAIFPETFYKLSRLLGIQMPVNTVFLIMTALLYALTFYVYMMISKHNEEIIRLTYEIAVLRKEIEELKKQK